MSCTSMKIVLSRYMESHTICRGLQDKLTNKLTPNTMEKAKAMFAIISDEALIADFFQVFFITLNNDIYLF